MHYFIPAWYRNDGSWDSQNRVWYVGSSHLGFDDTINQVRMFQRAGEPTSLLVPVYFPDLRYFAYEEGVYGVPIHSLFDDLQGIDPATPTYLLNYRDFDWPQGAEFIYGIFNLLIYVNGQPYARCFHDDEGVLIKIDRMAPDGRVTQSIDLDDRGFVSRAITFGEDGSFQRAEYLDPQGNCRFIVHAGGEVQVLEPTVQTKTTYPSLSAMLQDALGQLVGQMGEDDLVIAAAHPFHDQLLAQAVPADRLVMSYFSDRSDLSDDATLAVAKQARLAIADSTANLAPLKAAGAATLQLPPLDTRLRLGISNQQRLLKIFCLIDRLEPAALKQILASLLKLMDANPLIDLTLASYRSGDPDEQLEKLIEKLARQLNLTDRYTFNERDEEEAENDLADDLAAGELGRREHDIHYLAIDSESQLIKALHTTRLVVDLSDRPDVFLQIAGISAGVPELVAAPTLYVVDGENGRQLKSLDELPDAVHYYFDGLKNWNRALMFAANRIADYTNGKIVADFQAALGKEDAE